MGRGQRQMGIRDSAKSILRGNEIQDITQDALGKLVIVLQARRGRGTLQAARGEEIRDVADLLMGDGKRPILPETRGKEIRARAVDDMPTCRSSRGNNELRSDESNVVLNGERCNGTDRVRSLIHI